MSNLWYLQNPLTHADRRLSSHPSAWVRGFSCEALKPLIICRGPVRREAMEIFEEMGVTGYGILLSDKDSITYANALAPELRTLTDPSRVHRVPDYTGANKEERRERVAQMVALAHTHGYNSVFAGYGFMSEDEEMVRAVEEAGLIFIGPCSQTQRAAGLKDQAKRTALEVGVSVTPGVDDASTRALLREAPTREALLARAAERGVTLSSEEFERSNDDLHALASALLTASYARGVDLYALESLSAALSDAVGEIFRANPERRVRLKAIAGGGGKGQRILKAPSQCEVSAELTGDARLEAQISAALAPLPSLVREVLAELKCDGVGDNKNVIAELNIETTRHQEIQVVGNGSWCMTLGGRDCSVQMHEQKLLEVSVTAEELSEQLHTLDEALASSTLTQEERDSLTQRRQTLQAELNTLEKMEAEAARFGEAVGLDSVSTFECIVDGPQHYFMEMNTRIQVEHRVTELCYALTFSNPNDPTGADAFTVTSLIELMALLALHKRELPRPTRIPRERAAVEARLNATNDALKPHAGGVITDWSDPIEGEVRDDQGISLRNPDTGVFMRYHLAGAYDSNVALLLTVGEGREAAYTRLKEVLRLTKLKGDHLATNLHFHYGLVSWLLGQDPHARPTTRFVVPYLTALGELRQAASSLDLNALERALQASHLRRAKASSASEDHIKALSTAINAKATLIKRPLELLLAEAHLLGGWLSLHRQDFNCDVSSELNAEGAPSRVSGVTWVKNPVFALADLYHYLNMEAREGQPALWQIWSHDDALLSEALAFYAHLESLGLSSERGAWTHTRALLEDHNAEPPHGVSEALWREAQAAHEGFQAGLELLSALPYLAAQVGFFELKVNADLSVTLPERLLNPDHQAAMERVLVPPPEAKSDELVALSGGMFYPREAPDMPPFVEVGQHVSAGQPLYIVEVMKMFNKVYAPFDCTITEALVEGEGVIIKKGQPLFKVKPDVEVRARDPQAERATRLAHTREVAEAICV